MKVKHFFNCKSCEVMWNSVGAPQDTEEPCWNCKRMTTEYHWHTVFEDVPGIAAPTSHDSATQRFEETAS